MACALRWERFIRHVRDNVWVGAVYITLCLSNFGFPLHLSRSVGNRFLLAPLWPRVSGRHALGERPHF